MGLFCVASNVPVYKGITPSNEFFLLPRREEVGRFFKGIGELFKGVAAQLLESRQFAFG